MPRPFVGSPTIGQFSFFSKTDETWRCDETAEVEVMDKFGPDRCAEVLSAYHWPARSNEMLRGAFQYYAHDDPVLDDDDWETLQEALSWFQHDNDALSPMKILTHEETCRSLSKAAGTGFPFQAVAPVKRDAVEKYGSWLEERYVECLAGKSWPSIQSTFVKLELRPAAKLLEGSIHGITTASLDLLYRQTRLFNWLLDDYAEGAALGRNWSIYGQTKFYSGWTAMFADLNRHFVPAAYLRGDQKKQDRRQTRFMHELFKAHIVRQFEAAGASADVLVAVKQTLDDHIDCFVVFPGGAVTQKFSGNLSGHFPTTLFNCWCTDLSLKFGIRKVMRALPDGHWFKLPNTPEGWQDLCRYVVIKFLGDDTLKALSKDILELEPEIMKAASRLGVVWDEHTRAYPLEEVEFLSQRTLRVAGGLVPYPTANKILCHWMKADRSDFTVANRFVRACAYFVEGFWVSELREFFDERRQYWYRRLPAEKQRELQGLMHSRAAVWQLYLGLESGVNGRNAGLLPCYV